MFTVEDIVLEPDGLKARISRPAVPGAALIVALHGAGYDARYFDVAGQSVHRQVASEGLAMISITRPGYPADDRSAAQQPDFAAAARQINAAVGAAWRRWGAPSAGVLLLGHSVGAAIAVHVAAADHDWPLLGVAISGVGDRPASGPVAMFGSLPSTIVLEIPFEQCRPAFYGDTESIESEVFSAAPDLLVPFPSADVVEVNTRWAADLDRLAASVRVPLQYTLAEFDALWQSDADRVAAFVERFSNAPSAEGCLWPGVGHNLEHHRAGTEFVRSLCEFARRCAG